MSLYNKSYKKFILPASDIITGWGVAKSLNSLNQSQWWSLDKLKLFQEKRLKLLIKHAYRNVPYYKELFSKLRIDPENIRTIEDLKKIPLLTKEDITENFYNGKLIAQNINKKSVILKQSSGSTGLKTTFYIDKTAYGLNLACNLRGWEWMGYHFGDRVIKISQNQRHSFMKKIQDLIDRTIVIPSSYDEKNLSTSYKRIISNKNVFLRSYPDPLVFLCSIINKKSLRVPNIKSINTTGNILFPEYRSLIENTFGCKIFDSYSCEGGANFFECPTHKCYHVSMEYAITEILDSEGNEVRPGEKGLHVTTDLWNLASPLIRYNCKDIVEKSRESCSCGRNLLAISNIIGRDNDIFITSKGEYLIAQTFTTYFKYFPSILMFQVHQKSINNFEFYLKVNADYNSDIQNQIYSYWKTHLGNDCELIFTIVDNILPLPSGKNRFLIRNPSINLSL
jgi:phenylacetate-CoA ligase